MTTHQELLEQQKAIRDLVALIPIRERIADVEQPRDRRGLGHDLPRLDMRRRHHHDRSVDVGKDLADDPLVHDPVEGAFRLVR